MNLQQLTCLALALNEAPIARVRLAKTIYFLHKSFVRKKIMNLDDITYIRLPLGPAPEGLTKILLELPGIIIQDMPTNPLYEGKSYLLSPSDRELTLKKFPKTTIEVAQNFLRSFNTRSNLELVLTSQNDPSWLTHKNGDLYHLTPSDLKNSLPNSQSRFKFHPKPVINEIGAIQAALLRGMLNDIIKESTDLEYPDQNLVHNPNDKDAIKLRRFTIKLPNWPKPKKDKS